jgi:hypothetical protein
MISFPNKNIIPETKTVKAIRKTAPISLQTQTEDNCRNISLELNLGAVAIFQ